jgi:hypothetical protein
VLVYSESIGLDAFLSENIDPKEHKKSHLLQAVREDEINLEALGNECEELCYLSVLDTGKEKAYTQVRFPVMNGRCHIEHHPAG